MDNQSPMQASFAGFQIVTNKFLTKPGPRVDVPRGWMERLFTWPWRPWKAFRITYPPIPSDEIFKVGHKLIMHPAMADRIKNAAKEMEVRRGAI